MNITFQALVFLTRDIPCYGQKKRVDGREIHTPTLLYLDHFRFQQDMWPIILGKFHMFCIILLFVPWILLIATEPLMVWA